MEQTCFDDSLHVWTCNTLTALSLEAEEAEP